MGGALETANGFLPSVRYGATVKFISEKLDSSGASGYGLDAGLLLLPAAKRLGSGLGAENLAASRLSFISDGARPAIKVKTGVSYRLGVPSKPVAALLSVDLNFPQDGPRYLSAGLETTLYGALALRAGYSSFGDISNGICFGLAYKFAPFSAAPPAEPSPVAAPAAVPALQAAQPVPAAGISSGTLGNYVVASSIAAGGVCTAALQAGAVTDLKALLTTAAISSGKFGDERVSISTGAFYGGFNAAGELEDRR